MTAENEAVPRDLASLDICVVSFKGVDDGLTYEFSAAVAECPFDAFQNASGLIWNGMTPAQQKKMQLGSTNFGACLKPAQRDPRMRPMMPSDFFALIDEWEAAPSSFNLDTREEFYQHKLALRAYQERQEATWEAAREAALAPVRAKARELLAKRASDLGVSVDAMAIIEAMQHEFAKLHDRLDQIK